MKYSVIIPVYKNEASIPRLLAALKALNCDLAGQLEAVFVVDGSPDGSYRMLKSEMDRLDLPMQLLVHSRNFGSFAAIRSGLAAARGEYLAVMAADLQEPPSLLLDFYRSLEAEECDVAIGVRLKRNDPMLSRLAARLFWGAYRRWIMPDMPEGGVDVFGCNRAFRDRLLHLEEARSSLIALVFWLGFRRKQFPYERQARQEGRSSWTLSKKLDYMLDSIFSFTDYPIRLLTRVGAFGTFLSVVISSIVVAGRLLEIIEVPGYAALMIAIMFWGTVNLLGIGLVGTYAWRGYENSKRRPLSIVAIRHVNYRTDNADP
ncbi:glycosyltransferase family 2 protein [Bradyrhizobium shewense]|uniref:glycosyltransferase family 2 protein n=1 Tax=Bradyrhizobium shewense TaxID=1761772 RepID=UPI000B85F358|nr:glycosyltransferase family 2 protein [Bradyrhizobium shewense]